MQHAFIEAGQIVAQNVAIAGGADEKRGIGNGGQGMAAGGDDLQRPAAEHAQLRIAVGHRRSQRDLPEGNIATDLAQAFPDDALGGAGLIERPAVLGLGDDKHLLERTMPGEMRAFPGPGGIVAADPDIGMDAIGIERHIDGGAGDAQTTEIAAAVAGNMQHRGHQRMIVIAELADGGKGGMGGQKRQWTSPAQSPRGCAWSNEPRGCEDGERRLGAPHQRQGRRLNLDRVGKSACREAAAIVRDARPARIGLSHVTPV